tara:strand:+ start:52 stop:690 length:639 start_codon:yes stop_codon:yes gene_type:complete
MDKNYWDKVYSKATIENDKSPFAEFCLSNFFLKNSSIFDIAGGNGRDSIYFYANDFNIHLIDQSVNEDFIKKRIMNLNKKSEHSFFIYKSNILEYEYGNTTSIDFFYLRWIIHAINSKEEEILLNNISKNLKFGGLICIEARTINDHLFGVGKNLGNNSFYTDHFRRFIDMNEFISKIKNYNLQCIYSSESDGYSELKNDNPVLMRVILKKI